MAVLNNAQIIAERQNLCLRLKQARKDKKMTLDQVGAALNLDASIISKHELAYRNFGIDTLILLCRFYEINLTV
jgi:transcriptional regulator with XRE-family HTH domain